MAFVQRDAAGQICGIYALPQPGYAEEALSNDDPSIAGYHVARAAVPLVISRRQIAQALAEVGQITRGEAREFVKIGKVPAALQTAVDSISEADQRFAADMLLSGAQTNVRAHPIVSALGQALGFEAAGLVQIWQLGMT